MAHGAVSLFGTMEAYFGRSRERDGTGRLRSRRRSAIFTPMSSFTTYGSRGANVIAGRSIGFALFTKNGAASALTREVIR
jgi:hypothetical protein